MEGIVVKSVPFGDTGRVFTLFTQTEGLISVLVRKIPKKNTECQILCSPLARADYLIRKGKEDLYYLQEARQLDVYVQIRANYQKLHHALIMLRTLYASQVPHSPAPQLYALLKVYLHQLETTQRPPDVLAAGFILKLLKHEGYAAITSQNTLNQWDADEVHTIHALSTLRQFTQMPKQLPHTQFLAKVEALLRCHTT